MSMLLSGWPVLSVEWNQVNKHLLACYLAIRRKQLFTRLESAKTLRDPVDSAEHGIKQERQLRLQDIAGLRRNLHLLEEGYP